MNLIQCLEDGDGKRSKNQGNIVEIARQYFVDLFSTRFGSGNLDHVLSGADQSISA